jgi:CrcB protein
MRQLLLVGFGGFIGSIARFLVSRLNITWHVLSIPMGTLTVNIVGSFIIGILVGLSSRTELITSDMRLFLMVGICGGFTTFSSFTNENLMLMQNGQFLTAFIYIASSLLLGFAAVYLGYVITNLF